MFGIGFSELIVIGIILVIAVGPNRMPGLLKAVVRGYNEFRKATRELRASTGIDEILQDEQLRSLRKPLYVPPVQTPKKTAPAPAPAPTHRTLTDKERAQENPPEGVDIAEALAADRKPSPEEQAKREALRQQKIAAAKKLEEEDQEGKRIRAEKEAAAERIREQKMADAHRFEEEDEEAQQIRAEKEAIAERNRQEKMAAVEDEDEEGRRIKDEKIAAAERIREAKIAREAEPSEAPPDREE